MNYLLDTCILIDYLRGTPSIYDFLLGYENIGLSMSTVTMMELILGALNKREVNFIQKAFRKMNLPAASVGLTCKCYRIDEVCSVRKLFAVGL